MATRSNTRRAGKRDEPAKPDQMLSVTEFQKLPAETLRNKCMDNNLITQGKKLELAMRLFQHFHPNRVDRRRNNRNNRPAGNANGLDNLGLPPPPPEIIRAEDDPVDTPSESDGVGSSTNAARTTGTTSDQEDPDGTVPYDGTQKRTDERRAQDRQKKQPTPPPQEKDDDRIDLQAVIQKAVDSAIGNAVADAMRPVLEELNVQRQQVQLTEAENRALRSQMEHTRNTGRNPGTVDFSIPDPVHDTPVTSVMGGATNTVAVDQISPLVAPSMSIASGHSMIRKNPFALPGLLKKDLQTIEQGEYLDFDKIKPKNLDQRKREEGEEGFGVAMTTFYDNELGEETLRLKRVSSNKVEKFPEWLECWNKFMLARLHYHPAEQAQLMAYQRTITSFAKKFKFSAVYNYDIDFRKTMAAERSLPPEYRTAKWEVQHEELKNEHLSIDQFLAPKTCFKCKEKGHLANVCPNKNNNAFLGNKNRHNNNPRFQGPPPTAFSPPPMPPQPFPSFHQFQSPYYNHQPGPVGPPVNHTNTPRPHTQQNGKKTCNAYNHNGYCWRGQTCFFSHICNRCGESHAGITCNKQTSTSFAPQPLGFRPRF